MTLTDQMPEVYWSQQSLTAWELSEALDHQGRSLKVAVSPETYDYLVKFGKDFCVRIPKNTGEVDHEDKRLLVVEGDRYTFVCLERLY